MPHCHEFLMKNYVFIKIKTICWGPSKNCLTQILGILDPLLPMQRNVTFLLSPFVLRNESWSYYQPHILLRSNFSLTHTVKLYMCNNIP